MVLVEASQPSDPNPFYYWLAPRKRAVPATCWGTNPVDGQLHCTPKYLGKCPEGWVSMRKKCTQTSMI